MDSGANLEFQKMQARIIQLEQALASTPQMQERIVQLEQQLRAVSQHGQGAPSDLMGNKILVNKPVVFTGSSSQSLESFLGHMDLYLEKVPIDQQFNVAVSFLGEHAFDWYKVTEKVEGICSWIQLKEKLKERFEPVNKVQAARNKLAVWRQKQSVSAYNESFLKIIINIPNISTDEVIDRYTRGLKTSISTELCTHTYASLNKLMSDALRVENAKRSFFYSKSSETTAGGATPMDISNASLAFRKQREKDRANNACFSCHQKGCRIAICPQKQNGIKEDDSDSEGKDRSHPARKVGPQRRPFKGKLTTNNQEVPYAPLMLFVGTINGIKCRILKDDAASTNIISRQFWQRHRHEFTTEKSEVAINHSTERAEDVDCDIVKASTIVIGDHSYQSRFIVSSTRYDVILGTPWHQDTNPQADYKKRTVKIGPVIIKGVISDCSEYKVMNVSLKRFKREIRNSKASVFTCHIRRKAANQKRFGAAPVDSELQSIVQSYDDVFQDSLPDGLPPERGVDHEIVTLEGAKPPSRGLFRLSPDELRATREYIAENLRGGRIRPSTSPYGAPLFFAKVPGKPLRGVIDYRLLNKITRRNNTAVPRSDETFDILGGAKFFTKIDLKTGYHQIRVKPEHIEKTAFQTKYGHFEFLVMPMGLCNAPATFVALMNEVLSGFVDKFCLVYLDDILIFSETAEDHRKHVEAVLGRLRKHRLYASPGKCYFMQDEVEFLGIVVNQEGLKVNQDKISLIRDWPRPKSVSEIRGFIGLASFFRRFIRQFSQKARPLTDLTRKGCSIRNWDKECDGSFAELKTALTTAPILIHPNFAKPFRGHIDASQVAIGGTLTQLVDGQERVISYFSRKLDKAQVNYSANDRELLGLVGFLRHFRCYLEGSSFEIFTDNQVLKALFDKKDLSRKEVRWLELLGDFGIFPMTLVKGSVHVLGDVPSRAPHSDQVLSIQNVSVSSGDLTTQPGFKSELLRDQFFGPIIRSIKEGSEEPDRYHYENDILRLKTGELCVPRHYVRRLLREAHEAPTSGHQAVAKTMHRLKQFHWRKKTRDVVNFIKGCIKCQKCKADNNKPLTEPAVLEQPLRRWGSVAMDFIVGLPPTKTGHDAIMTVVDRFSKRPHFIACKSECDAKEAANLFRDHVFKLHGLPDSVVSDRDPRFTSRFWSHLMALIDVQLKMSTSNHPQSDGQSEVLNRIVEEYLRLFCNYKQDNWDQFLPTAEFAYSSSVFEATGLTPFFMDLGWEPKSPLQLLAGTYRGGNQAVEELQTTLSETFRDAQRSYSHARHQQRERIRHKFKTPAYKVGDMVLLKTSVVKDAYSRSQSSKKLTAKRIGPFPISELVGRNAVRLELPATVRIHPVVNVSHTTPFHERPVELETELPIEAVEIYGFQGPELQVKNILNHRKRGRGYQFLVEWQGQATHEASWEPTKNFVDNDGTVTASLLQYLEATGLQDVDVLPKRRQ
eukprot:IDg5616t1